MKQTTTIELIAGDRLEIDHDPRAMQLAYFRVRHPAAPLKVPEHPQAPRRVTFAADLPQVEAMIGALTSIRDDLAAAHQRVAQADRRTARRRIAARTDEEGEALAELHDERQEHDERHGGSATVAELRGISAA